MASVSKPRIFYLPDGAAGGGAEGGGGGGVVVGFCTSLRSWLGIKLDDIGTR